MQFNRHISFRSEFFVLVLQAGNTCDPPNHSRNVTKYVRFGHAEHNTQAQIASIEVTIPKPLPTDPSLVLPLGPRNQYETIEFASTNLFQVVGMTPGYHFGISNGEYIIKCDGVEVVRSSFGIDIMAADSLGEWKAALPLGGTKSLLKQRAYVATANASFNAQFGGASDDATTNFKIGPFTQGGVVLPPPILP